MNKYLILCILIAFLLQNSIFGQSDTYSIDITNFSSRKYDEFSPVYYKNGLVFCTNRKTGLFLNYLGQDNKGLLKIHFVDISKGAGKGKLFSRDIKTRFNDGPASFSKDGDTIYYSRNLKVDGSIREITNPRNKLGIFSAINIDGNWIKGQGLRFNNEYYNITTPYISPDGNFLFFASDNPEGFGGTDLYYSEWKTDYWDDPVNLGPEINTAGNESYPYVNSAGGLFFSSDGHEGLGGKDIFYTEKKNGKWQKPVHLDPPINSQFDDFGLIADSIFSEGYFSSGRKNSIDIYHYNTNFQQMFYCSEQRENQYCFIFTDKGEIPVDDRYIQYIWSFSDGTKVQGLNAEHCFKGPGAYTVSLDAIDKNTGRVFFTKQRYDLELKDIEQPVITSPNSALSGEPVQLDGLMSFFPGSDILLKTWYFGDGVRTVGESVSHTYKEKGDYEVRLGLKIRDNSTGVIRDVCVVKPLRVFDSLAEKNTYDSEESKPYHRSDIKEYDHAFQKNIYSVGEDSNQDMVFHVELLSSGTRLSADNEIFKKLPAKFTVKEFYLPEAGSYSYVVREEMSLMNTYPAFAEILKLGFSDAKVKPFVLQDAESKELNNLKRVFGVSADAYFRPGTYNLSSAGTQFMDLVLGFMSKYPGVKLEIEVHTDTQGSAYSNQVLSQRRAEAMVNYLVINGINRNKLIAKGYGGTRPVASNILEADRKLNRRVDFTIVK